MVNIRLYDEVGRDKIRKYLEKCNKIADIGCNKQKIVGNAIGFDNDINVGADVICDLNSGLPIFDGTYDGICMSHILEHIIDTRKMLNECYDALGVGGRIAITVPDGESVCSETLGDSNNTHEMLFTPTTLKLYLENARFKDVHTEYYDRPTAWRQTKGVYGCGNK